MRHQKSYLSLFEWYFMTMHYLDAFLNKINFCHLFCEKSKRATKKSKMVTKTSKSLAHVSELNIGDRHFFIFLFFFIFQSSNILLYPHVLHLQFFTKKHWYSTIQLKWSMEYVMEVVVNIWWNKLEQICAGQYDSRRWPN